MTVGELTGFIDLEDKGFASELRSAENSLGRLESTTSTKTASIESTVTKSFSEIERAIADGLDPASAIADLDQLERELDTSLADMLADADRFAAELDAELDKAFSQLDDDAKESGKKAGQELAEGLKDGLKDAPEQAREQGRKTGQEFGDGVEDGGGGGRGGGRMAGIGESLIGGLKAGAVGLAAAAGAAIGGMLLDGIKTAMEREDLFATLAVKVGAFGAESERLGTIAGELYADAYGESLGDVTDALARVLQNIDGAGKLGDSALKDMTAQALTVAKVMDEDVSSVTRAVAQMLRNDLAPSAKDAFDVLIRGQQEGVNKSDDLLDTFNEYSTIFRDLGLDAKDALGLLAQGLKAGARDSDTVADALKELDIRVKDMSAAPALKALGLNAKEMADAFAKGGPKAREALQQILEKLGEVEDPAKRSQLAVALFGTKAEDMAKSINALNLDQAKTTIGDFSGAVQEADKTLGDTASASADQWSRSWENVFAALGEQAMTELKKMFPSPADVEADWNEFTAWFDSSVGPFFADSWASVKDTTVAAWDDIIGWLGQVPTRVQEFFVTGWNNLKAKTAESWEGIKSGTTRKADELVSWLRGVPGKVRDFFVTGWNDLKTQTASSWEGIKTSATQKADELVTWLKALPGKIKAVFSAAGSWLLQAGRDLINGMINGIKSMAGQLVESARGTVQNAVDAAKNLLGIHSPSKVFEKIGTQSMQGFVLGMNAMSDVVRDTATSLVNAAITGAQAAAASSGMGSLGMFAGSIGKNPAMAGLGMQGVPYNTPPAQTPAAAGGQPAVNVDLRGSVIREEADIGRLTQAMGLEYSLRGATA
jgi:phage-related minor tail protein